MIAYFFDNVHTLKILVKNVFLPENVSQKYYF